MRTRGWLALAGVATASALAQELAARRYYASTPGPDRFFHDDERRAWTPLWREGLAGLEWLALLASPVHRGEGVPHGDGAPVMLVQGFLTKGLYLSPLRRWLERIGYRADIADIGWNAECLDVLADRLTWSVHDTAEATGRAVHLVGHSLGGLLVRATAARARDHVASVATLGSPFRGFRIHPLLQVAERLVRASIHRRRGRAVPERCFTLACECDTARALTAPLPDDLPQTSIVTRADGFTDWRYCADPDPSRVVEVAATHIGMVVNATVYRALAEHLAASTRVPARN